LAKKDENRTKAELIKDIDHLRQRLAVLEKRKTGNTSLSEEKFSKAFRANTALMAISTFDEGRFTEVNDAFCRTLGFSKKEIIGKTSHELGIFANYEQRNNIKRNISKTGTIHNYEIDIIAKNGETRHGLFSIDIIELADGPYFLTVMNDITERKRAEKELAHLRNLLSNIVDCMPSALVGMNLDRKITQWNKKAEEITGVAEKDALGHPIEDILPKLNTIKPAIEKAIQSRQPHELPKVVIAEDSEPCFWAVTVYPLITDNIEGVVIRIDDISSRVQMEEMMIQSEKMLSVGGLAAGMAHEINNPLAGIMQSISVMQNRLFGDMEQNVTAASQCGTTLEAIQDYMDKRQVSAMLDNVLTAGDRASKIVHNMLSFSRKNDDVTDYYPITSLLDQTIDLASSDYDLKKRYDFRLIDIVRNYDRDVPMLKYSYSKIQQVFLNILKNGAEAMCDIDTVVPRFVLRVKSDDTGVLIEIEDNGPGMTNDVAKRVFEPFFTTKKVGIGTGLGLYVSYFIVVENHGGSMSVKSQPGKGTTFLIRLPIKEQHQHRRAFWEAEPSPH
jgi:PAS domain S-box-containing protein